MNRREFIKLSALAGGSVIAAEWLFDTQIAAASTAEYISSNGVLKLKLIADEQLIKYNNTKRWAMTYNGVFPAPTLRAKPGDTLQITLVNKLNQPTNLHTHGLHTSPSGNGDNPLIMIKPGETFEYSIKVPLTQKAGTFWYHPHHHELSAGQVASGLAGALIIEDALDNLEFISNATERVLILADPRIGTSAAVAKTSQMDLMHGRSGPNTLVNGELLPTFKANGTKVEHWRLVNTSVSLYQKISVPGTQMWQIATDSSRLPSVTKVNAITLTPGQRTELLIAAPQKGSYSIQNGYQTIAKIDFSSKSNGVTPVPLLPFSKILKVNAKRKIVIEGSGMGMMSGMNHEMAFTFDGKAFDPKRVDQNVKFGAIEEWTISNPSTMDHPFHLHVWPFQVADDGNGNFLQGWHDTINLPAGKTVKIRIPFVDIKGTTVYHCHILDHEDGGMMGIVKVS